MAIRFDAAADRLLITSSLLDYNQPYTVMGWFYLAADQNDFTTFITLNRNAAANKIDRLYTDSDGVTLRLTAEENTGAPTPANGSTLTVGTWVHLAMVRESTDSLKAYLNAALDITRTNDIAGRDGNTRLEIGGTLTTNTGPLNGRAAGLKAWQAALSQAEIEQEMPVLRPVRQADLYGFWPGLPGAAERIRDYSGSGHDWTEGGTLTDEAPPAVSWGGAVEYQVFPGVGSLEVSPGAASLATSRVNPAAIITGPVLVSPAAASAAGSAPNPGLTLGPVSVTPVPNFCRVRREGPVSDTTTLVHPWPCEARAGRADPGVTLGAVTAAPPAAAAKTARLDPGSLITTLCQPDPCSAAAGGIDPELFFSSLAFVPAQADAATSTPPVVYRVLNVTVYALSLFTREINWTLGERPGVHLVERWELEDGTGHWRFEDGSRIVLGLGQEGTKFNLWDRSLAITLEERDDA